MPLKDAQERPMLTAPADALLGDQIPDASVLNVLDIPRTCGKLSPMELDITENYSASALSSAIVARKFTSEQVVRAFAKRAAIAHQLFFVDEAVNRAQEIDSVLERTGRPVGPLHGVPISVKEQVAMKGKTCNASWVAFVDRVATDDAKAVKCLYNAGAVFYVRTNQPQSIMQLECSNNITGTTVNPFNRSLTAGGSSGGESALLAMKGSVLGVGTDIGASNCGLYALRSTAYRLPSEGAYNTQKVRESIVGITGPMARYSEDLELYAQCLLDQKPWLVEPSLVPLPWRPADDMRIDNLRVAVMWSDNVVNPQPPVRRALCECVDKLRRQGVRVENWEAKDHDKGWALISKLYYLNGAVEERQIMEEGHESALPLTEWIMSQPGVKVQSWSEARSLVREREAFRSMYADLWNAAQDPSGKSVDVILCPTGPGPAPKLGQSKYWSYTSIWNLLDYPAAVFPVTKFQQGDLYADGYVPISADDKSLFETYAPIGLQLVGRRFNDEIVMKALELVGYCLHQD